MAVKYSTTLRNALLDAIETYAGTSPKIMIFTGAEPAKTAADSGTLLATINLPSDWLAAAASGSKSKLGTWSATAAASGTASYFRLKTSGNAVVMQGSVGTSAADLLVDSTTFSSGQAFTITSFTINAGMA